MARALVKISFLYLILGVALATYSEYAVNFTLQRLQINVILLGWPTMAVLGLVIAAHNGMEQARLTRVSVWLYVISATATLLLLWVYLLGNPGFAIFVVVGYFVILVALILLAIAMYAQRK